MKCEKNGYLGKLILGQSWGIYLFRGILSLIIGIMFVANPAEMIAAFLIMVGFFFTVSGIFAIISAFKMPQNHKTRWFVMIYGLLSIIAGIIFFFQPQKAEIAVILIIAVWALITGIGELASSISLNAAWPQKLLAGLTGLISIIFGLIFITRPGVGLLALAWVFGFYFIIAGCFLIMLAFSLCRLCKQLNNASKDIDVQAEEADADKDL